MSEPGPPIAFRLATSADSRALTHLAGLDSAPALSGIVLMAERDGELVAAIELASGTAIANPFRPTGDIVAMLALQRRQLAGPLAAAPRRRRRLRLIPGRARAAG